MQTDVSLNIIVVGDRGTGKTQIVSCLQGKTFSQKYRATIGGDIEQVVFYGKTINFWDMSGDSQEGAACVPPLARICNAAFVVFDESRKETYSSVEYWKKLLGDIPVIVLANKSTTATREGADFAVSIHQALDALIAISRSLADPNPQGAV